jgi:hypothetical protein
MSYSFNIKVTNKTEAKEKVAEEFAKVVKYQPVHAADKEHAEATVNAFIDLLDDDATMDVQVDVSGSVGWRGSDVNPSFTHANVSVSAYHVTRAVQEAA